MRPTIKDVAKLANVSTATVSNVLTKKKFVSPDLEEKIRQAMNKLNYKPNTIARSLKVNRSFNIGLMVPDITNPFFGEIVKYAEKVAHKENYQITLCNSDNDSKREKKLIDIFLSAGVDGIINVAPRMKQRQLNEKINIPMLIVDRPHFQTTENIAFVYADNYISSASVAQYFVEKGYSKFICFAGPVEDVPNAFKRLSGFLDKLKEYGFSEKDCEVYYCDFTFDSGYNTMDQLLKNYNPLDHKAAFISSDITAWGAIEAAKAQNLQIPKDIAIAGYDNIYFSKFLHPGLTTVENPTKELGTMAAQLLIDVINSQKKFNGNYIVVSSSLIERQST